MAFFTSRLRLSAGSFRQSGHTTFRAVTASTSTPGLSRSNIARASGVTEACLPPSGTNLSQSTQRGVSTPLFLAELGCESDARNQTDPLPHRFTLDLLDHRQRSRL